MNPTPFDAGPLRIGISSCLLGEEVRFDGGHKRDRFLTDLLADFVEFVPVCPEVEAGLGTPREAIHLEQAGGDGALRIVGVKSGTDHTRALRKQARSRVRALADAGLCGYVLKRGSPSCGMERVKVFQKKGMPSRGGRGLFAAELMERMPLLPVEEEGRLNDPPLRENWIERIFAYRRLRNLFAGRLSRRRLVEFHTAHKLQLMAHSPKAYRELGRLVGDARDLPAHELRFRYESGFMEGLAHKATPGRNRNVLEHMLGYFRDQLDADTRAEIARSIEDYHARLVPLVVPLSLVAHYVRKLDVSYLRGQVYLQPHPKELMLRNHV
ncbi:MAG TPA: DUF523 and DUF1722 domain-containing protein [Myxococcota bacterium]|nr:DUF523 and DUF1722 domain-containing protein [Myxococcota bacterium]